MKDDDEEEENTFGVQRYPCMPSLVALQQMRNRLHLAFLGRKLMKWTALATGRELRRLAAELYEVYEGFGEDMRNAFILLARSRYFCPQLNHIVTEDIAQRAAVVVQQSTKQVSSVKIVQFEIFETEYPPYEHLGLEKGGQTILETKKAWLELLKRIIMMMQLRASFLMVEVANRNATKKMNVLKKIVIPRTHVTMGYILTELEEMAREEFHRLKKVKEKKKRDRDLKEKKPEPLPTCTMCVKSVSPVELDILQHGDETTIATASVKEFKELYTSSDSIYSVQPSTCAANRLDYLKSILNDLIINGKDLLQSGVEKIDIIEFLNMCETAKLKIDEFFKVDEQGFDKTEAILEQKLTNLKLHLVKVIEIILEFQPEIELSPSVENFVQVSQGVEQKLDIYLRTISVQQELGSKNELDELKDIINDVKKITAEYRKQDILSQDVDEFIKSCDAVNLKLDKRFVLDNKISCGKCGLKLDQSFKCIDTNETGDDNFEHKLEHVKCHLHEVIDIIKEIKPVLNLPFNVESFTEICQEVDEKLNIFKESKFTVHEKSVKDRLIELRDLITGVTNITREYKKSGLLFANVDEFLETCDDMNLKINIWTQSSTNLGATVSSLKDNKLINSLSQKEVELKSDTDLQHLIQNIDDTIGLGIEAKAEGILGESVEDLIKAFEEIKDKIETKSQQQPKFLLDLESNVQEIMSMIKKLKEEGVITVSVEDFLKLCDKTKHKMHSYERKIPETPKKRLSSECVGSCINKIDSKSVPPQDIAKQPIGQDENPICGTCSNTFVFENPSNESVCITCTNSVSKQQEKTPTTPLIVSEPSSSCNLCKLIAKKKQKRGKESHIISERDNVTEPASACDLCKLLAIEREKETKKTRSESRTSSERESRTSPERVSKTPENVASDAEKESLGYYETQKHKEVRVVTRQNSDGTVWEETETITMNRVKRDPTITSLLSDDDDTSDEHLDEGSTKHINLCTFPGYNSHGFSQFIKRTQSDVGIKNPQFTEPRLRRCVSLDVFQF